MQGVASLKTVHGKTYRVGTCQSLLEYTASGSSLDWALAVGKIPYSFGMELRPDRPDNLIQHILNYFIPGFILPAKEIIPTGEETWAFHKVAAEMIINEFAP